MQVLPSQHFLDSFSLFFCLNKDENLFSFLASHIIVVCTVSLLESLVPVFSQRRMVDFGPSSSWVTTASDMTCQQLQSYPNTPCSQKKSDFTSPPNWPPVWSPQPAQQAFPCSSPANHRLTDTHLPTHFMSCGQWVWVQGHTFQSDSCFSVLSGVDRGVRSVSGCMCAHIVLHSELL